MNKAALYARYSTDRQRETSIEDQLRLCRQRATDLGLIVVAEFSDEATSGSTRIMDRPGSRALMSATVDVLIVESLDRLSRDMIDQETTVRRLEHRGIRLIGVSDGYDSESSSRKLQRGVRGIISEVYLDDLRYRIQRMNNRAWREARDRAGLHDVRVHDLRHTFGMRLRAAGVSYEDRQDLLGHYAGRITTHYSRVEIAHLIECVELLARADSRPDVALVRAG
jgi:DNA invertase Pin-like site-specific DNA recombinase